MNMHDESAAWLEQPRDVLEKAASVGIPFDQSKRAKQARGIIERSIREAAKFDKIRLNAWDLEVERVGLVAEHLEHFRR